MLYSRLEINRLFHSVIIIQTNDQILHFAELGIPEACRECIIRDVMTVDQIEYDEVCY